MATQLDRLDQDIMIQAISDAVVAHHPHRLKTDRLVNDLYDCLSNEYLDLSNKERLKHAKRLITELKEHCESF